MSRALAKPPVGNRSPAKSTTSSLCHNREKAIAIFKFKLPKQNPPARVSFSCLLLITYGFNYFLGTRASLPATGRGDEAVVCKSAIACA
jgi:hypothetical protein